MVFCVVTSALFTLSGAVLVCSKHPSVLEVMVFILGVFVLGLGSRHDDASVGSVDS